MGSRHSMSYRLGMACSTLVAVLIALGSLAACDTTNSVPGQHAGKTTTTVAGCPPVASATTQDALARRACAALGNQAQSLETVYSAQTSSVRITVTVGGAVPLTRQQISAAQELTKSISLHEQQAMWVSGVALKEVKVTVMGPTQDEYAEIIAQVYGSVVLDAATAARFDWANLSAESAWDRYTSVYLRPTFDVVDDVPVAP
jgi:hypothetical protein